ncbi:MAG: hypothetical protein F9K49_05305 [Caedimonadaceae bacterium]|nr:MAG: hypothetical protein F9K49_05305 [Caedimonadaceae bacterium]
MLYRILFIIVSIFAFNTQYSFASQGRENSDESGPYKKMLAQSLKKVGAVSAEQARLLKKTSRIIQGYEEIYEEIEEENSRLTYISSKFASLKDFWSDFVKNNKKIIAAPVLVVAVVSGAYFLSFMDESGEILEIVNATLNATVNATL